MRYVLRVRPDDVPDLVWKHFIPVSVRLLTVLINPRIGTNVPQSYREVEVEDGMTDRRANKILESLQEEGVPLCLGY